MGTYPLTQQRLLTVLIPMETEVAIQKEKKSTILATKAQDIYIWSSYCPLDLWKILDDNCNLHHCVLIALASIKP